MRVKTRWFLLCLVAVAACGGSTTAPESCAGIALAPVPAFSMHVTDTAVTVYDTVTLDPSVHPTDDASRSPITKRGTTGKLSVLPLLLRVYNAKLPATVIPVAFFVRGLAVGQDTILVTTSITGPQCASGAVQRIPVTVTP